MSTGIGETLREARQEAGVRLADAAAETRIRQSHLLALEEENFAPIGGDVYVKGFIRSYARHLGLDPEPLIATYNEHFQAEEDDLAVSGDPIEAPPPPRRPITTIVVVLAVLLLGGLYLLGSLLPDEDEETVEVAAPDPVEEEPPDEDPGTREPADQEPDGDQESDPSGPSEATEDDDDPDAGANGDAEDVPDITEEVVLTLSVPNGRSWARVVVDGQEVEETTFESGYTETFNGDEILLRLGDASSVSLEVNGEELEVGGTVVDITCSTAAGECEIG